jgi:hypothetical protein
LSKISWNYAFMAIPSIEEPNFHTFHKQKAKRRYFDSLAEEHRAE